MAVRRWSSRIIKCKISIGEVYSLAGRNGLTSCNNSKNYKLQTLFWNVTERWCFKFPGAQEVAAKRHTTGCILGKESLNVTLNLLID